MKICPRSWMLVPCFPGWILEQCQPSSLDHRCTLFRDSLIILKERRGTWGPASEHSFGQLDMLYVQCSHWLEQHSPLASHQSGIRFSVKAFKLEFSYCSIERSPVEHINNRGGSVHLKDSLLCQRVVFLASTDYIRL